MAYFNVPTTVAFNQTLGTDPGLTWKIVEPAVGGCCCGGGTPEVVLATSAAKGTAPNDWDVTGTPGAMTVKMPSSYTPPSNNSVLLYVWVSAGGGGGCCCCGGGSWTEYVGTVIFNSDHSIFVSQTVSLTMPANSTQSVTVTMQNNGNTTWQTDASNPTQPYRLASRNATDNYRWNLNRVLLSNNVVPGDTYAFVFTITAPSTPGTYDFQWGMVHDGVAHFSVQDSTNQSIVVSAAVVVSAKGMMFCRFV